MSSFNSQFNEIELPFSYYDTSAEIKPTPTQSQQDINTKEIQQIKEVQRKRNKRIDFSTAAAPGMFAYIFPAIIMSFILISLWADFLTKFFYGVMGFDRTSAWDALLLAGVITFIVAILMFFAPYVDE